MYAADHRHWVTLPSRGLAVGAGGYRLYSQQEERQLNTIVLRSGSAFLVHNWPTTIFHVRGFTLVSTLTFISI